MATSARPAYTDSKSGVRYDTNDPDFEGWLTKQSMWLKDWRRRYFLLKNSRLFFAKSPSVKPHGMINLAECITVKSAEVKAGKRNAIEVSTPNTTYLMYADDERSKDDWIGAIGRAIVQASGTFTEEQENSDSDESDDETDSDNSDNDEY